eukprot:4620031-Pleurochrysis_carterae.AAC.3
MCRLHLRELCCAAHTLHRIASAIRQISGPFRRIARTIRQLARVICRGTPAARPRRSLRAAALKNVGRTFALTSTRVTEWQRRPDSEEKRARPSWHRAWTRAWRRAWRCAWHSPLHRSRHIARQHARCGTRAHRPRRRERGRAPRCAHGVCRQQRARVWTVRSWHPCAH